MSSFIEDFSLDFSETLLSIVSNGHAIIAEFMRLSEMIPTVYKLETKNEVDVYGNLIFDFSYFKNSDQLEKKLEENLNLQKLDIHLKNNYLEILTRFFVTFESAHKYVLDLNKLVEDLDNGIYIQQTLENIFFDENVKQLLCESIYIFGVILLTVDQKINGLLRERLLIGFYRYCVQSNLTESKIEDICSLFRSTSYTNQKRPLNYPEEYFSRIKLNPDLLTMVIGHLRADDIYNQLSIYQHTDHRSMALSNQAAILYITLYFQTDILHNQNAIMREIVDKFFPDNFVISIYMGTIVNLVEVWDSFKAAKKALANTIEFNNIKRISYNIKTMFQFTNKNVEGLLKEGTLSEAYILNNSNKLINLLKQSNVSLKWTLLHVYPNILVETNGICNKKCRQLRELISNELNYSSSNLFDILLSISEIELIFKNTIKEILSKKEETWLKYKNDTFSILQELSQIFSGNQLLTLVEKNESFVTLFKQLSDQINSLTINDLFSSNKKIIKLIGIIEEAQEFQQLDNNLQVKQHIIDSKKIMHSMLKISNFKSETLFHLQVIGDLSYSWVLIDHYTNFMQESIEKNPKLIKKISCIFLKLATALDIPLVRISQANSSDLESVSQHYSSELVLYIRKVLQIIPATMFQLMERIINLQTNNIKELPTKLDKFHLKQYAYSDQRFEIAKCTNSIAVFADGLLMMKTILVGVIKVDSMKLLEDGIRKELVKHVSKALHTTLNFKDKPCGLEVKLVSLCNLVDGLKRSFEYIQDYLYFHGLKLFQEELSRVINFNVEQECNKYCKKKVMEWESLFQSKNIPIPSYSSLNSNSTNFIGRLCLEFIQITNFRKTIYSYQKSNWYDNRTQALVLNNDIFKHVLNSIGVPGMNGLDKYFGFKVLENLNLIQNYISEQLIQENTWLGFINDLEESVVNNQNLISKKYITILNKFQRNLNYLNDLLMQIGQLQLLKMNINQELDTHCRVEARTLDSALKNLNNSLLLELKKNTNKIGKLEDNALLYDLSNYLEWNGISDTLSKIYDTFIKIPQIHYLTLFLIVSQVNKFTYSKAIHSLHAKRPDDLCDGVPFIFGILTWLHQHQSYSFTNLFTILGKYLNTIKITKSVNSNDLNEELINLAIFLNEFTSHGKICKNLLFNHIPQFLFDHFHSNL